MADPDGRELILDVPAFDWGRWKQALKLATSDGRLTCLGDEADSSDVPIVRALYELALQVHNKPDWDLASYLERFDSWDRVFLAMHGDTCIGYTYARDDPEAEATLNQGMTAVLPAHRRRGIGLALKLRMIEYAQDHGWRWITTSNSSSRTEMIRLNTKLGFVDR